MVFDTVITNARLISSESEGPPASLAIREGKIAGIFSSDVRLEARELLDVGGRYVLPGVIDPHLHLGIGNGLHDYLTETKSAALGGVTTVVNYLLTSEDYDALFVSHRKAAEQWSCIDFAFHFGAVTDQHIGDIGKYINEMGVPSFKLFMSFKGDEGARLGIKGIDDGFVYEFFKSLSGYSGAIPCVHAENIEVVWRLRNSLQVKAKDGLAAWDDSRPMFVEVENIRRAVSFAESTGCPIYLVHLSGKGALQEFQYWKKRYGRVYGETCPHYLTHSRESGVGLLGKVNPPLRTPEDMEALWEGIRDGTIDTIGSDHVPRRKEHKSGEIWNASPGLPGTGTLLPVLLSEGVNKRGIPLGRVVEITSARPAKIFGLYPQKGALSIGSDADLVVIDLGKEQEVNARDLASFSDYSLYDSWKLKGWPVLTMVRGRTVMEAGKFRGQEGFGKFIRRPV
jgi:dihydropyrimidinase